MIEAKGQVSALVEEEAEERDGERTGGERELGVGVHQLVEDLRLGPPEHARRGATVRGGGADGGCQRPETKTGAEMF